MLPTTPTKKKPAIFTSLFSNGQRDEPVAAGEPAPAKGRVHLIREVFIRVVSLVLAVAFIVWGPAGNFIAGRAFTVSMPPAWDRIQRLTAYACVDHDDERGHICLLQLDGHPTHQHAIAEYASLEYPLAR
jgi:hypothetical protein